METDLHPFILTTNSGRTKQPDLPLLEMNQFAHVRKPIMRILASKLEQKEKAELIAGFIIGLIEGEYEYTQICIELKFIETNLRLQENPIAVSFSDEYFERFMDDFSCFREVL